MILNEENEFSRILGDDLRARIIAHLCFNRRVTSESIPVDGLGFMDPLRAVQRQLLHLKRFGLVSSEREGKKTFYSLNLNNPFVNRLTIGVRTWTTRSSEEEMLNLLLETIREAQLSGDSRRTNIFEMMRNQGFHAGDARLSQLLKKLKDRGEIERWKGGGVKFIPTESSA